MDRLIALEKQVVDLKAELAALKKAPAQASPVAGQPTPEQYADLRRQMDEVLAYLEAQAQSAEALSAALEDSRVKGFTFGINPDSRIVMLDGFGQFTMALQTNVPSLVPPIVEPAQK